jgi:hypothetical protein
VRWTKISGPAEVTFSAPQAPTTTVTFSTAGRYRLQLSATNGVSTVADIATVTVNSAASQTAFYVDPTYSGTTQNGSAHAPWKTAARIDWSAISDALATNDVIIYFSARMATADISESVDDQQIFISRLPRGKDPSTHRLTLDGMSKYNTNEARPEWVDYAGTRRFRINRSGASMSIGWDDSESRDYVTIRGFEVTGSGSRILWGGSYSYLEHMWVHDVTSIGATVQFNQAVGENGHGCPRFGRDRNITIRNNIIERGIGEGIYFGGNYLQVKYGGCPDYGNTHSDILIEDNTIADTAQNGGEGDGIDLKAGLTNVTVRNNVVSNTHRGGTCIVSEGVFPPAETDYLIEENRCTNITGWAVLALIAQNGTVIQNNVLAGRRDKPSIYITEQDRGIYPNHRISIYNNTIYNTSGIGIDHATGVVLRNNLLLNNSGGISGQALIDYDSDYNFFAPVGSRLREGSHSIVRSGATGFVVDAAGADFHLTSISPAIDKGIDLSIPANLSAGSKTFGSDVERVTRPQGPAWDIGAHERPVTGGSAPR